MQGSGGRPLLFGEGVVDLRPFDIEIEPLGVGRAEAVDRLLALSGFEVEEAEQELETFSRPGELLGSPGQACVEEAGGGLCRFAVCDLAYLASIRARRRRGEA